MYDGIQTSNLHNSVQCTCIRMGLFDYLQSEDQIASDFFSISLKVDMRKDSLKL